MRKQTVNLIKAKSKTESHGALETNGGLAPVVGRWLCKFACAIGLLVLSVPTFTVAEDFQLSLNGGSVITVDVSGLTIDWTDVSENGDMEKRSVPFSDVKQLLLSKAPASKQVAEIRRYLNLLANDDYLKRESAEEKLSDPEIGGRFKSLIKNRSRKAGAFEVRYRIKRILGRLDDQTELPNSEFDRLTLKDGSVFEGDAGDLVINCDFRGNKSSFTRNDLRLISTPIAPPKLLAADSKIEVRMFHGHEELIDEDEGEDVERTPYFYLDHQVVVDFDNAPNGAELQRHANINDTFVPFGLRLDTPKIGYMGISGYPFKFAPLPVSDNSICVTETIGSYPKRFKGIAEVRFCLPNQAAVPAGVLEFGVFIARVNHSRDLLLEAYNADGELLAGVESSSQNQGRQRGCVFSGVKANEPITKVRILSNPYLFRLDRTPDIDFAMDSMCFSPPVPVSTPADSRPGVIRLKNGDLLKGVEISTILKAEYLKLIDETAAQNLKLEGLGELFIQLVAPETEMVFEKALKERLETAEDPKLKEVLKELESGWEKRPEVPKNPVKNSLKRLNAKMFETIKILDDKTISIQVSLDETMTLPLAELQTIRFANELDGSLGKNQKLKFGANRSGPNTWTAILKDRSTLFVEPGEKLTSTTFNLNFDIEDIAALKTSKNPTRYPEADDFDNGKHVLVFPTCRIASDNMKFSKAGFEWDPTDQKLQQPVSYDEEEEDPTPDFHSIKYAKATPESTPTVWLAPPTGQLAGTGKLRLTDGQQLTLGSENGFQIASFDKRSVVLSVGGKETRIPIEKVLSIEFPK